MSSARGNIVAVFGDMQYLVRQEQATEGRRWMLESRVVTCTYSINNKIEHKHKRNEYASTAQSTARYVCI